MHHLEIGGARFNPSVTRSPPDTPRGHQDREGSDSEPVHAECDRSRRDPLNILERAVSSLERKRSGATEMTHAHGESDDGEGRNHYGPWVWTDYRAHNE